MTKEKELTKTIVKLGQVKDKRIENEISPVKTINARLNNKLLYVVLFSHRYIDLDLVFRENKYTIEDIFSSHSSWKFFLFQKSVALFNSRGISLCIVQALSASCKWKLVRVNKRHALCTLSITEYIYFRLFTRTILLCVKKKRKKKYDIFSNFPNWPDILLSDRKLSFIILFRVKRRTK